MEPPRALDAVGPGPAQAGNSARAGSPRRSRPSRDRQPARLPSPAPASEISTCEARRVLQSRFASRPQNATKYGPRSPSTGSGPPRIHRDNPGRQGTDDRRPRVPQGPGPKAALRRGSPGWIPTRDNSCQFRHPRRPVPAAMRDNSAPQVARSAQEHRTRRCAPPSPSETSRCWGTVRADHARSGGGPQSERGDDSACREGGQPATCSRCSAIPAVAQPAR